MVRLQIIECVRKFHTKSKEAFTLQAAINQFETVMLQDIFPPCGKVVIFSHLVNLKILRRRRLRRTLIPKL